MNSWIEKCECCNNTLFYLDHHFVFCALEVVFMKKKQVHAIPLVSQREDG